MSHKVKKDKRKGASVLQFPVQAVPAERNGYLCVRGPIYGQSGYARMAHNLIRGLHSAGKKFWVDAIPWTVQPTIEVPNDFREIIKANFVDWEKTNNTDGFVCICLPTDLPSRPIGKNTFNMTIFETTQVPDQWIKVLNSPAPDNPNETAIRGLILPCRGNLQSFEKASQKKTIVPISIDYDIFSPDGCQSSAPHELFAKEKHSQI